MTEDTIQQLASKHGFSPDAIKHMYQAILIGRGTMAQFSHPEFGGAGQWMRGGMTMVGDMFNHALKARVDALCNDLSHLSLRDLSTASTDRFSSFATAPASWWPAELGHPAASGGQNDFAYAYFPKRDRLVIQHGTAVTIYDTTGYEITQFSQQQSGFKGLYFSSRQGLQAVADLPVIKKA